MRALLRQHRALGTSLVARILVERFCCLPMEAYDCSGRLIIVAG